MKASRCNFSSIKRVSCSRAYRFISFAGKTHFSVRPKETRKAFMSDALLSIENQYNKEGIFESILVALKNEGIDEHHVTRKDIAGADEFHVRGQEVTRELAVVANLKPGDQVLDAGSGLGGPSRLLAAEYGCNVTGIDITKEYVRTAGLLSKLTGLDKMTRFITGNVLGLPFEDQRFDAVWTQHVQMNIGDKERFYEEITRVLRKGGTFVYYDIFSIEQRPIHFPVPWADTGSISHLASLPELRRILDKTGLEEIQRNDETEKGISFFNQLFRRIREGDIPKISLGLLMGNTLSEKLGNLLRNLVENRIILESGIYRKR
jgi:SAM-dependent methyltransferase